MYFIELLLLIDLSQQIYRHKSCNKPLRIGDDIETIQAIIEKARLKESEYRKPAKDSKNIAIHQDNDQNGCFISSTFHHNNPILPSTRLTATMAIMLTWMHKAPDNKILSKCPKPRLFAGSR